ncbi:beta-defensin 110-like [Mustela erminea]|uniref:beta-defensin 110-like n=1 Tax=Mustela erminea TaxID=36723 RepID=UPI001386DC34|nr:beta-defensin 110-like [Mustela erminea]
MLIDFISSIKLPVSSGYIKFWESQKLHVYFQLLMTYMSSLTAARNDMEPKYQFQRCERVKGRCKTFCDDDEYDYGSCIKWRNQCCI